MLRGYQRVIQEELDRAKITGIKPNEVEAFMRLQYGTLDHLDRETFRREVTISVQCIDLDPEGAATLAASYGL